MKKVTIKGVDGKEISAYVCSDHPANFPTDATTHEVEDIDLNNLNEMDVNENSAGCGAHEETVNKKCCGGGCHSKKTEFPNMIDGKTTEDEIKEWAKSKDMEADYVSPLGNAFEFGYNIETDPLSKLLKMAGAKFNKPNKNEKRLIDDTIESDILETKDLKLGKLYRVAGVDLVARFVAEIIIPQNVGEKIHGKEWKTLLQIKHHGNFLYVDEKSLVKASNDDVKMYLNTPF